VSIALKCAGNTGPFSDPELHYVINPSGALAGLASAQAKTRELTVQMPLSDAQAMQDGLLIPHIQSLGLVGSPVHKRCLAWCRSGRTSGASGFASLTAAEDFEYRSYTRFVGISHPSGLGGWGHVLAVACEDDQSHAVLRLFADPVGTRDIRPFDELVIDPAHFPIGSRERSGAAWLAFTRLASGQFLALIGGSKFGRETGWAVLYDAEAPKSQRFSLLAAYAPFYQGPLIKVVGKGFGEINNASFVIGQDGSIYLVTVASEGSLGFGRFTLYAVERESDEVPVRLRYISDEKVFSQGNASFRYGSCLTTRADGGFTSWCSERGSGSNLTLYEVRGVAPV
jgi:hypothetical protein